MLHLIHVTDPAFTLTLSDAIDAFRANPCDATAVDLRSTAQQYAEDKMITEAEMWHWIGESEMD
jgi:hypothetical protein